MRPPIALWPYAFVMVAAALAAHLPDGRLSAQARPLWRYVAPDDIEFFRITSLGTLIVATKTSLAGVDPRKGSAAWTMADVMAEENDLLLIPNTPFALLGGNPGFEIIDVGTGQTWWNSGLLPSASSTGRMPLVEQRLLLVFTKGAGKATTLLAVDLESGKVRWRQDHLFLTAPEPVGPPGDRNFRKTMLGHQRPIVNTDTTMVLHVSKGGPIKIDLRTGALLWRSAEFGDDEPPAPIKGYASMVAADTVLYVPSEKRLLAIDLRTGRLLWQRAGLQSNPRQLDWTPHGLVARIPHIDLLDPRTGASLWSKPFTDLKHSTPYVVRGDRIYVAAHGVFHGIKLADGTAEALALYQLRGVDQPDALELLDSGFVMRTAQNLVFFDTTGVLKHHLFYEPPKLSALARVAFAAAAVALSYMSYSAASSAAASTGVAQPYYIVNPILSRRYGASTKAREYQYVLTVVPDTSGKKGPGLVKLNAISGKEEGQLWLGDRTPDYQVDPIEGLVFFRENKREIVAYRM